MSLFTPYFIFFLAVVFDHLNGNPDPNLRNPDQDGNNIGNDPGEPNHLNNDFFSLNGLTFSIQNVRSLNISTKNDITTQKIVSLCSLKSDFVFLSDLRLNSTKQISAINDLEKMFQFNSYKFIHNSTTSSRGVGFLVKKNIWEKLQLIERVDNEDGNFLLIHITLHGRPLLLGSIYGPNRDNEVALYTSLKNKLSNFLCPIILGGDWNATWDISNVESNLDVVNMRSIPSMARSQKIHEICNQFKLIEPFRTLYPNKKEYTFIPSGNNDMNRSRLDFFLMSQEIFGTGTCVLTPHSLSTTLFDHKHVTLSLNKPKTVRKGIVKDTILDNVDLPAHVKAAVFECYLQHCVPTLLPRPDDITRPDAETINTHLLTVGRIMVLLDEIKNLELKLAVEGHNERDDLIISAKRAEISLIFEDMPDLEYFENLYTECNPSIFFQTFANCVKNEVISHQNSIYKLKKENKTRLNKKIQTLKQNFDQNVGEILATERQLTNILENELRIELSHYSRFEILNNEKITRHFMNLVKTSNGNECITEIKRGDNTEFATEQELKGHIFEYYKEIYSQPINRASNTTIDDINEFLGPIGNNDIVQNAKLTNEEKEELDREITMEELTASINESNMASAPGADGISNRFIRHFWDFFKVPLLKLTRHSYEINEIPLFFRTANIKLIPKKGDLSKIKNWRPISLLNCFYKILSRVITRRLKKYMDKMTPICQKGYSSTRYCQEVLIQVMEGIEKCNNSKIKGAVVSLDIKKAFDSLSHKYLQCVYKFYNFGPNLIKWITMLSTKRQACVILTGNKTTDFFDLERGNAQGDTISPFLFNLGYQLLLFKLELCLQIEGTQQETVARLNLIAREADRVNVIGQPATREVRNADPKVMAMADDCTILLRLKYESLKCVIDILQKFEEISGLGCNVDKSSLMPVGTIDAIPDNIINLGLAISDEITLLGAKIKNTGICFEQNSGEILRKIKKQTNFWRRFNLSLPGRIGVSKTFLYSQINYLGNFLPFRDNHLREISSEIENFVRGNLKIGKQKFYERIEHGGLGLFKLSDYLCAQRCAWVKRAYNQDELWKCELASFSYGSVFNLRKSNFSMERNPILYTIAESFEKFTYKFSAHNENFREMFIFDNPCLTFDINHENFF